MERARKSARGLVVAACIALPCAFAQPAFAVGSVSMTVPPSATVSGWSLATSGANTTSGGSMTIDATAAYIVTVVGDVTQMSEWNGTAYIASGKTLTSAMSVITSRTGGTATLAGLGATALVSTVAATAATGTGIGTDEFSITLSQPTAITDAALPAGRTYHIKLSYTASLVL